MGPFGCVRMDRPAARVGIVVGCLHATNVQAITDGDAVDLVVCAAAARLRFAAPVGGDEGARLIERGRRRRGLGATTAAWSNRLSFLLYASPITVQRDSTSVGVSVRAVGAN